MKLSSLQNLHDDLKKNFFYKRRYSKLQNGQTLNHWERIYQAIKKGN